MGEQSWRELVRENNEPGSPNILLTLEDAAEEVNKNPDVYEQAFVILYRKGDKENHIKTAWFNAGLHFSELVFLLEYLKDDFLDQMRNPRTEEEEEEEE